MKFLQLIDTNRYLADIGMIIGGWGEIRHIEGPAKEDGWLSYPAPSGARELLNFSQHICGWLPPGGWKMVRLDNSTNFDVTQATFFGSLIAGYGHDLKFCSEKQRTLLFEFDKENSDKINLLISHLVNLLLLFDCHAQVVSSGGTSGEILSVQDGYVYFLSRNAGGAAQQIVKEAEMNPLIGPQWIQQIIGNTDSSL
ncbi:MAG: hypothetical protein AB1584_06635 [Pseudomonadota bacterium]